MHELIGRDAQLTALEHLHADARDARPVMVTVEGIAGIGKSFLVENFLARHPDLSVIRATGVPWESGHCFGVVEQLMHVTFSALTPAADVVEAAPDPIDVGRQILEFLVGLVAETPVVVVVDDAHWADIESLQALSTAVRRMSRAKVLIILVTRIDPPGGAAGEVEHFLARTPGGRIFVGPVSAREVREIAAVVGVDLPAAVARRLWEHTEGNPLYVTELLNAVPPARWREWWRELPVPHSMSAAVRAQLASCRPAGVALVEAAAVLGRPQPHASALRAPDTSFSDAARLANLDDAIAALDEAHRAGLLTTEDNHGTSLLVFPHPLTRAAVYAGIGPARRGELHRRATGIVDDDGRRLAHRVAATPFTDDLLADELETFADRKATGGEWGAVADALIEASRLSTTRTVRETRLIHGVDALLGAGDLPPALAFAPEIDSFEKSALSDAVLGYLATQRGRAAEAELYLTSAWKQCDPIRDPATAAMVCQRHVLHSLGRLRGRELLDWVARGVELAGPDAPPTVESEAIKVLGLGTTGQIAQARATCADLSPRVRLSAQLQRFRLSQGWLDLALDDPETARSELESAVSTTFRGGSIRISLWAQAWLARTQFVLGTWDEALVTVNHAAARLDEVDMDLLRPLVHWTGAQISAVRGEWDAAYTHARRAYASPVDYEIMLVPSCLARAHLAEVRADYDGVVRSLAPLVDLRSRQGIDEPGFWPWHDVYANALVMAGHVAEADAFLRPHEALAAERGHRSTLARLGYVRGRIVGAGGDLDSARDVFESALRQLERLPLPYERARVNFAYGQTLRRAGRRRAAHAILQTARDGFAELGATSYVARCDRELQAGSPTVRRGNLDPTDLTPQERSVAALVASGMSNKEAAGELFLSAKTVQFHLTRIYAKLGIRSRSELAARLLDRPAAD